MKTGVRIGEWELVRQLNSGGMGQVWQARKAFATGDIRVAAIKLLRPSGVLDKRSREALLKEAGIQMRLQHDNIPKVVDVGVYEGLPYLVMDYIAGRDLSQLLKKRSRNTPLDPKIAAHIGRNVAYALDYAHNFEIDGVRQEVIHRDVASKNIMLSGRGGVFVLDFGVAEARSHKTSHNAVKGTLLYMAPEHIQGFPSTTSDAFGLGTILWEMLENRVFRSEVPANELRAKVNEGWSPPLTRPGVGDELRFVVEGLLRKDPRDRLTIAEVIEHLENPEFPAQRMVLAREMHRNFGAAVMGSGQTLHDFKISDELDQAIAAGAVAKNSPPLASVEKTSWSKEAFDRAGAPTVVATSDTRSFGPKALDDDEDSRRLPVGHSDRESGRDAGSAAPATVVETPHVASAPVATEVVEPYGEPEANTETDEPHAAPATEILSPLTGDLTNVGAATTERLPPPAKSGVPVPRIHGRTAPAGGAQTSPMFLSPQVSTLPPHKPSAAKSKGISVLLFLPMIVVLLGLGTWALLFHEPDGELVSETQEIAEPAEGQDAAAQVEPEPSVEPLEPPTFVDTPAVPAPPVAVAPPVPVEPEPQQLPFSDDDSPDEETQTNDKPTNEDVVAEDPPPSKSVPGRARRTAKAVARSKISVAIGFVEAMDISIGGARRTLRMKGPDRATFRVRPGRRTVRWGPPGQPLRNSKVVVIASGTDYHVNLGGRGPVFHPIEKSKR